MEQQMLKEILQAVKENKQEINNVETRLKKEIEKGRPKGRYIKRRYERKI